MTNPIGAPSAQEKYVTSRAANLRRTWEQPLSRTAAEFQAQQAKALTLPTLFEAREAMKEELLHTANSETPESLPPTPDPRLLTSLTPNKNKKLEVSLSSDPRFREAINKLSEHYKQSHETLKLALESSLQAAGATIKVRTDEVNKIVNNSFEEVIKTTTSEVSPEAVSPYEKSVAEAQQKVDEAKQISEIVKAQTLAFIPSSELSSRKQEKLLSEYKQDLQTLQKEFKQDIDRLQKAFTHKLAMQRDKTNKIKNILQEAKTGGTVNNSSLFLPTLAEPFRSSVTALINLNAKKAAQVKDKATDTAETTSPEVLAQANTMFSSSLLNISSSTAKTEPSTSPMQSDPLALPQRQETDKQTNQGGRPFESFLSKLGSLLTRKQPAQRVEADSAEEGMPKPGADSTENSAIQKAKKSIQDRVSQSLLEQSVGDGLEEALTNLNSALSKETGEEAGRIIYQITIHYGQGVMGDKLTQEVQKIFPDIVSLIKN